MRNSRATASPALYREIREKAEEIVSRRGPMLGAEELALELGVKDKRTAADWARLNDVPATPVGRAKKYEARLVAKAPDLLIKIRVFFRVTAMVLHGNTHDKQIFVRFFALITCYDILI